MVFPRTPAGKYDHLPRFQRLSRVGNVRRFCPILVLGAATQIEIMSSYCCLQTIPLFARRVCPLTQAPSGLTRNETTMSSGTTQPFQRRHLRHVRDLLRVLPLKNRSVAVGPGATAFTEISRPRSSLAKILVRVSTAATSAGTETSAFTATARPSAARISWTTFSASAAWPA